MKVRIGMLAAAGAAMGIQIAAIQAAAQIPEAREGQQVVLVTGSTDGLGREVALRLGAMGAHVIVHGRNAERGAEVVAEIERGGQGSARFFQADFASLEQVRGLASEILEEYDRLDLLVNNAGIGSSSPERELSQDGHELRFQVNYLSGFLLTRMLLPLLMESAPARIVNVASAAQNPIDFADVMMERGYTGARAYGQSKLAQIHFTFDLAEELDGRGVIVNALHPATYMDTQMVRASGRTPLSTVDEGADAVWNLITAPGLQSGQYFNQLRPAQANAQAYDRDARMQLRTLSMELAELN
ncbi:MAG: SDR family NAD(P)-dependent oxidoreductase [Gemmatimonadota bacterium]